MKMFKNFLNFRQFSSFKESDEIKETVKIDQTLILIFQDLNERKIVLYLRKKDSLKIGQKITKMPS